MLNTLDWFSESLVPTIFAKLDSWYVFTGVSLLGIFGAIFFIWFVFRRFV